MESDMADHKSSSVLYSLERVQDIQRLELDSLEFLAREVRDKMIATVSKTGGHLAPSLGVVDLTVALLKMFNPAYDRIVWDVGHQAYAYKILTGRLEAFDSLRQIGGLSGFPRREESEFDHFGVGHSSTSISAALGMAVARDLAGKRNKVVAVIGDGSTTAGQAYEGLNQAGDLERDMIVVLNDNEMSIAKNVGALSSFLSRKLSSPWVVRLKKEVELRIRRIPKIGSELADYARRSEDSLKVLFTPGMLFEAFKFNYVGPINGHDIGEMLNVFELVRQLEGPVLVHVLTRKGKGYEPAEKNPVHFHGVGSFEQETGMALKKKDTSQARSYTSVFGQTLLRLSQEDEKIVAITAAMPEGTGLNVFKQTFPDRFYDVGICEQHAVTFAAGLATQGFRPFVAVYSTFLQRSYDQVVHDVCLQNLPVVFCLDRAGLVGEDGPTHHGVFDFSYLRHIPNITIMAPKDENELARMLVTAHSLSGPVAVRYPRGPGIGVEVETNVHALPLEGEMLRQGSDGIFIAVGSRVYPALAAAKKLQEEHGLNIAVYNCRLIKPLPGELLNLAESYTHIVFVEENVLAGGFSSAVLELWADNALLRGQKIKRLGIDDRFVEHGPQHTLRDMVGIHTDGIARAMLNLLEDKN